MGVRAAGFVTTDGRIFFAGETSNGIELWTTDGTQAGTHLVKDINPGSSNSSPHAFTEMNGKVYFAGGSCQRVIVKEAVSSELELAITPAAIATVPSFDNPSGEPCGQ